VTGLLFWNYFVYVASGKRSRHRVKKKVFFCIHECQISIKRMWSYISTGTFSRQRTSFFRIDNCVAKCHIFAEYQKFIEEVKLH